VNPSRSRILLSRDLGAVAHETSLGYYQRCVFCNEIIEQGDARAAILMFDSDEEIKQYQLDAHLNCLRQGAHPEMVERVDPAFFEGWRSDRQ
jgi:hypothetical protein